MSGSFFSVLFGIAKMGCVCAKETILVEGKTYIVLEHIGDGGFSRIDLVEDRRTRKYYALKRITCHSTEDQIAASREIEFHKHLKGHRNILDLIASQINGSADIVHNKTSEVLLILPYYPNGTLHDELVKRAEKKKYFPEHLVLSIFSQICDGVHFMHSASPNPLAHRDLKPHNILLDKDFTPVIMDLGSMAIARVKISSHAQAQQLQDLAAERCSMPYRSPELFQVNSKCDIDERTDVWSLGCLLYAICFFKSPYDSVFERGDSVALAVQSSNALEFPANSPFSSELRDLIKWMLTPEIAMRPHLTQIMEKVKAIQATSGEKL